MTPPFSATPQHAAEFNAFQKIGFLALLAFLYSFNSRVLEVTHIYYLHGPLILGMISGGCALLSGGLVRPFQTRVGICYLALTLWFAAGVPSAYWRGGSVGNLESWLRTLAIWAFFVGLTVTYRECKLLLNTLVFASATAALLGLTVAGQATAGRLGLDIGLFSNPNYFALSLLVSLPFVWRLYWSGGRPGVLRRLVAAGFGGLIAISLMKTGSRMGLYAVAVMALMVFIRGSLIQKVQTALAIGVAFAIAFGTLPSYLRERYFTFAGAGSEQYESDVVQDLSAAASTLERQNLFRRSVSVTLEHPFFGVGLGNFSPYVFQVNRGAGRPKEAYLGTHNTYTQLSSEAGVPALLIFLGIIVTTWRSLTRLIRATRNDARTEAKDVHATAQATQVCLAAFCFSLCFTHIAYEILPHMLIGLALAVAYTGERELRDLDARQLQPMAGDRAENPGSAVLEPVPLAVNLRPHARRFVGPNDRASQAD